MEDFEYVVNETKKPKVAFLSGQSRKSVTEHRRNRLECNINLPNTDSGLGPGYYPRSEKFDSTFYKTLSKVTSKRGFGGLANRAKRFKEVKDSDVPAPNKYKLKDSLKLDKPNIYGFNSKTGRERSIKDDTPGISMYDIQLRDKDHSIPFEHSFGGRTKLKPFVQIKCTPENKDICTICGDKPCGDYWIATDINMATRTHETVCAQCYYKNKLYCKWSPTKTPKFQKIRDCSTMHSHEGTTATLPLMTQRQYWNQTIKECYFANYTVSHTIQQIKPPPKRAKTIRKDIQINSGTSDALFKKISKFIHSLYSDTEAEYLQKRDISDKRARAILTPLSLVPDQETLMKYLTEEKEPLQLKEYPTIPHKKSKKIKKVYSYKYKSITYTMKDVLPRVQKQWPKTKDEMQQPLPETEIKSEKDEEMVKREEVKLQDTTEPPKPQESEDSVQYAVKLLERPMPKYSLDIKDQQAIKIIEEDVTEETVKPEWSDLDLLQDPNIPPMPRGLKEDEEHLKRHELDPEIASLFSDSLPSLKEKQISMMTIASLPGYPHLKL